MNIDVLAGTVFNALLMGIVAWLLNDKLKNMDFRMARIESTFFEKGQ